MNTLRIILFVIFILDAFLLVIAVLLQSGRGGGLAGALGGIGGADSALGVRAASQIEKATGILGAIFFVVVLGLAWIYVHESPVAPPVKIEGRGEEGGTLSGKGTTEASETTQGGEATGPAEGSKPAEPMKPAEPPAEETSSAPAKTGDGTGM